MYTEINMETHSPGAGQRNNRMYVELWQQQSDESCVHLTINTAQYANNPLTSRPVFLNPVFYKYVSALGVLKKPHIYIKQTLDTP